MNTKELLPVLGSGALREALERLRNDIDASRSCGLGGWSDQFATRLDEVEAALSLSSPIEPPSREAMKAQWEIYRKQRWPDREEGWSNHWSDIAIDFALALAQPPQASSEIRGKMMASFDKVIPSVEMRVQIVNCILAALATPKSRREDDNV